MNNYSVKRITVLTTLMVAGFCNGHVFGQFSSTAPGGTSVQYNNAAIGIQLTSPYTLTPSNVSLDLKNNLALRAGTIIYNSYYGAIDFGAGNTGGSDALYFRSLSTQGDYTTWTTRMLLSYTGNLGIGLGNTFPAERLDVSGTDASGVVGIFRDGAGTYSNSHLFFATGMAASGFNSLTSAGDNGIFWSDASGWGVNSGSGFVIGPNKSSAYGIKITSGGNVGIGVASPTYPLQVNGDISSNGTLWGANATVTNTLTAQTVTASTTGSSIQMNGSSQTITTSSGTVGFSNNNITTTGNVNAATGNITTVNATSLTASSALTGQTVTAGSGSTSVKMDGTTGTITSPSGTVSFGTNTIMAQNINPTQTLTTGSGTSGSSIKIDGTAGTITSPSGSVGFGSNNITTTGTISAGAFNVSNLNATTSITAPAITTDRIKPMLADSIIHMGDSSFNFQVAGIAQGNIWYTPNFVGALGYPNIFTNSNSAYAVGSGNIFAANNAAISLGFGLTNTISNSLMLGFGLHPAIFIGGNNYVGVETTTPSSALEVNGVITVDGNFSNPIWTNSHWRTPFVVNTLGATRYARTGTTHVYMGDGVTDDGISTGWYWIMSPQVDTSGVPYYPMSLTYTDNGFNASSTIPTLNVNGLIRAQEVRVCLSGCDFVFERGYKLMGLTDLDKFIQENHHLPGIASATEMESDKVSLGKLDSQLLQKVEELTLYVVQQQKRIDELERKVSNMNAENK